MRVKDTAPVVVSVTPGSVAERFGVQASDEISTVNGIVPRDVIEWRVLTDGSTVELEIRRGGLTIDVSIEKNEGEPLGADISSAVFDRVRTCDNHCPFCFIYQLPTGMRKSLYLKDDDYRLSFLYGNFTTLTRFTEADLERVLDEGLSPLNVSIHSTDPVVRTELLRNRRGAVSLRWLRELLDNGVKVNGQIVVCPGINDGYELTRTLIGVLDEYPELHSVAVVPLGVSQFNPESTMREHTIEEAERVIDIVEEWQVVFRSALGRTLVFAADEYYLMADRPFPEAAHYDGFHLHEDGIGMARTFEMEFHGHKDTSTGTESGFFAWVDGAPADGYRAIRNPAADTGLRNGVPQVHNVTLRRRTPASDVEKVPAPIGILTGEYGARVLEPLIANLRRSDVRIIPVKNSFFGGNIAVTGLMVAQDIITALEAEPVAHRYLLPDVCLSEGRFLDGLTVLDLPREVEVIPTDGNSLRRALENAQ